MADSILKLVLGHVPEIHGAVPKAPHPPETPRILQDLLPDKRCPNVNDINNNVLRLAINP